MPLTEEEQFAMEEGIRAEVTRRIEEATMRDRQRIQDLERRATDLSLVPQQGRGLGNISSITKLTKTNYREWIEDIEIELKLRGLRDAITNYNADELIDLQVRRIILETMDKEHRSQVRGYSSAKEILDRLKLSYAEATDARKHRTLVKFFRYFKDPADSIDTHVGKIEGMRADLRDLEFEIDEEILLATIIGSLPPEYGNVLEAWELAALEQKTKHNLIAKLLNKEIDLKDNLTSPDHALAMIKSRPKLTKEEIAERKKTSKCGYCKEIGHWHKECPKKEKNEQEPTRINLNVGLSSLGLESKWISDSGATSNMCNNIKWFSKIALLDKPKAIKVGDGNSIEVKGVGEIEIKSKVSGREVIINLSSVLYIPTLMTNLISVGWSTKRDVTVTFDKVMCRFVKGTQTIMIGKLVQEDLYVLDIEAVPPPTGSALITKFDRPLQEWPEVLGHQPAKKISQLLKDSTIPIKEREVECATCPEGKGKRVSHPSKDESRAEVVGRRVHIDLVHSGNKGESYPYYLLSKDEASEYYLVHMVESKADTCDALEKMIIDFELASESPIRIIQSDNGSEFTCRKVKNLLAYEKIKHETSTPYVSQQNGLAERAVQTLNNTARTLILSSGLPSKLIGEAIKTACYLVNRVPTKRSNATPHERFTGRKPYLGHLVRFGEPGHMLINDKHLRKFDARTKPCYVVGYTPRRNTYRVYVPSKDKVVQSCDVIFAPHRQSKPIDEVDTESGDRVTLDHPIVCNQYSNGDSNTSTESEASVTQEHFNYEDLPEPTQDDVIYGKNGRPYINQEQLNQFFDDMLRNSRELSPIEEYPDESETEPRVALTASEKAAEKREHYNYVYLFVLAAQADISITEPQTYLEAMEGPNKERWREARDKEVQAHEVNQTWTVVDRPASGTTLTAKWIFRLKRTKDNEIERFKARIVARGYEQREGIDFKETYAPVACVESIRLLIALAATKKLTWTQFDITTAFLNGEIIEDIFVEPPEGVEVGENKCLKLKKALYGLKQAPRAWSSKFKQVLAQIGFVVDLID